MSAGESDDLLLHSINSNTQHPKISLQLLPNSHLFVDWSDLPKHRKIRQCVIHYKSLNNNRSHAIRVSRKKQNFILQKIQPGHLYEVHVCTVGVSNQIIASSERLQIQTTTLNDAPVLRVKKSTPDFVWLEWEKSDEIKLSDIEAYKLIINGEPKAILPPTESKFVVSDGELGEQYIFQLEMSRKDGKMISSLPVSVRWPGVTIPKHHTFVNGCEELIICWGDSMSINDGNIQSYMLYLHDSDGRLTNKIGPNPAECRQLIIKDVTKGVYFYVLEIELANSKKSITTKPMRIECGRESRAPLLTCDYTDSDNRKQLIDMAYRLINIRDNMKSKRLLDKCENQLKQILFILTNLADFIRLNLSIESKYGNNSKSHRLIIDDRESETSMPWFVKHFPLQLPRRDKPYELAVSVTPDFYGTKSKNVLVEASGDFTFFCDHFHQQRSTDSCSYMETLPRENQFKQPIHQGHLKSPQVMNKIQVYDLNENKIVSLPSLIKTRRSSIIFFYMNRCVPSITHLNYFSTYASTHRTQYNYISVNCNQTDIDNLKQLTHDLKDIQCYTDFLSEDFEYEQNENEKPLHELLSIDGVPMYFILDFSGRIVWRGRLSIQNQSEYNASMDHIMAEVYRLPCFIDNCQHCQYRSLNDTRIDSELNDGARYLQSIVQQQRSLESEKKQHEEKPNRMRRVVSMKNKSYRINDNEYH